MPTLRGGYADVATLRDDQTDLIAVITQRQGHQRYTVGFFKEFLRENKPERSTFMDPMIHFAAIKRLMIKVDAKIAELKAVEP